MSARMLDYFAPWKEEVLTCPRCHWRGRFEEGMVDHYDSLMDCTCPACPGLEGPILAIVPFPTAREWECHSAKLPKEEKAFGDAQVTEIRALAGGPHHI